MRDVWFMRPDTRIPHVLYAEGTLTWTLYHSDETAEARLGEPHERGPQWWTKDLRLFGPHHPPCAGDPVVRERFPLADLVLDAGGVTFPPAMTERLAEQADRVRRHADQARRQQEQAERWRHEAATRPARPRKPCACRECHPPWSEACIGTGGRRPRRSSRRSRVVGGSRAMIGDGAVGLLGVLSAKRLGAEQIILMGRHQERTDLGREFGATDVVSTRGDDGIAQVRELTGGHGTHVVLECVGNMPAYQQATGIVRPGGVISRVGVPQYEEAPIGFGSLFRHNIRLAGGPAPVRAYIEELMPDILSGTILDMLDEFFTKNLA